MMVRKIFILYQIKEKSMSMWELLINDEVIDRVDLNTDKYEEAHTYFRLRKNLKP